MALLVNDLLENCEILTVEMLERCWMLVKAMISQGADILVHDHVMDWPNNVGALGAALNLYDHVDGALKPHVHTFIRSMLVGGNIERGDQICFHILRYANDALSSTFEAFDIDIKNASALTSVPSRSLGWKPTTHLVQEQEIRRAAVAVLTSALRIRGDESKLPNLPNELWFLILTLMDTTPSEWVRTWQLMI